MKLNLNFNLKKRKQFCCYMWVNKPMVNINVVRKGVGRAGTRTERGVRKEIGGKVVQSGDFYTFPWKN